jgi:hypothetical protein
METSERLAWGRHGAEGQRIAASLDVALSQQQGDTMSWSMVSEYEADVAPDDVYRHYVDPSTWGSWAHNTRWGRTRGSFEAGSKVDVRVASYPWTYAVLVREVEEGRRVVTEVRPFGVVIVSTYEVSPAGAGARLRHTIEVGGPLERAYRMVEGMYTRMLQEETRRLADIARQGSGARTEQAPGP